MEQIGDIAQRLLEDSPIVKAGKAGYEAGYRDGWIAAMKAMRDAARIGMLYPSTAKADEAP